MQVGLGSACTGPGCGPQGAEPARAAFAPGVVAGVVRTPAGAAVLCITAMRVPGSGRVVGVETAAQVLLPRTRALLALVAVRAADPVMAAAVFEAVDVHLSTPAQSALLFPRDADLAVFLALASMFSGRLLPGGLAAAARVDRQGRLLPGCDAQASIGAAARAGADTVVLPARARVALPPRRDACGRTVHCLWLNTVDEVLRHVMSREPGLLDAGPSGLAEGEGHGRR